MDNKAIDSSLDDQLFKNMIANNWVAVVFANMNNIVEYVNPSACQLYGYDEYELIGQTTDIFNSHLSHNTDEIVDSIKEKGYWSGEIIQRKKDNSTFNALLSVQLIMDEYGIPVGFASNSKDITEEIKSAQQLKKTVEEKETLLKELHHRVKNNLSIIKGILSLQSIQYSDPSCLKLIEDFKNRIDAVATLHNTLYSPNNLNKLNLKVFINDLCSSLNKSYNIDDKKITIDIEMEDHFVNVDHSIPLCLIINEVITNTFKHAFNDKKSGNIKIILADDSNIKFLTIKDNGIGFDYYIQKNTLASLGLTLIEDLSNQIDSIFEYTNNKGMEFKIRLSN